MIKAVFFDLYQTLVHYKPSQEELEAQALEKLGFKTTAEAMSRPILAANEFIYRKIAEKPLSKRSREEVAALYTEYQRVVLKEAGIEAEERAVIKLLGMMQKAKMEIVPFEDALPALAGLKERGLVTGLISNIEKNMTETLRKLGLSPKLDVIVTSQEAGAAKPQPEIFHYAMRRGGVQPAESIYAGDQYQVDIAGARAAGMKAILLDRTGYYGENTDCPVIKGLGEIVRYLE